MDSYLGIDVGSVTTKLAVLSEKDELVTHARALYLIMLTSRTTDDLTPPDALKAKV